MEQWQWLWLPLAVLSSFITAQNVEINRRARQDGYRLHLWRMGFASLVWLPLAVLLPEWPRDGMFYAAAMFAGVGMLIGFTIQNDLANRHNGRVAILHMPMKAVLVFAAWAVIDPVARRHVMDNPLVTLGVLGCLAVMVASLAEFRKHDVSWHSLKAVMPIVVVYATGDILARSVMHGGPLVERMLVFLSVMTLTSCGVALLIWPWRTNRELPLLSRPLVRAGAHAALGSLVNQACFFSALVLAPSPAYASMIALLAPVWLLVYHRLARIPDNANPFAGTVMVAAAIVLMVLVA